MTAHSEKLWQMYVKTERVPEWVSQERFAQWLIAQLDEAHQALLDIRTDAELIIIAPNGLSQKFIRRADRVLGKFGI